MAGCEQRQHQDLPQAWRAPLIVLEDHNAGRQIANGLHAEHENRLGDADDRNARSVEMVRVGALQQLQREAVIEQDGVRQLLRGRVLVAEDVHQLLNLGRKGREILSALHASDGGVERCFACRRRAGLPLVGRAFDHGHAQFFPRVSV